MHCISKVKPLVIFGCLDCNWSLNRSRILTCQKFPDPDSKILEQERGRSLKKLLRPPLVGMQWHAIRTKQDVSYCRWALSKGASGLLHNKVILFALHLSDFALSELFLSCTTIDGWYLSDSAVSVQKVSAITRTFFFFTNGAPLLITDLVHEIGVIVFWKTFLCVPLCGDCNLSVDRTDFRRFQKKKT